MSQKELKKEIEKVIEKEYTKSDKKLIEEFFIKEKETAVTNSKFRFQSLMKEHEEKSPKEYELDGFSTVYRLIEFLRLKPRKK